MFEARKHHVHCNSLLALSKYEIKVSFRDKRCLVVLRLLKYAMCILLMIISKSTQIIKNLNNNKVYSILRDDKNECRFYKRVFLPCDLFV